MVVNGKALSGREPYAHDTESVARQIACTWRYFERSKQKVNVLAGSEPRDEFVKRYGQPAKNESFRTGASYNIGGVDRIVFHIRHMRHTWTWATVEELDELLEVLLNIVGTVGHGDVGLEWLEEQKQRKDRPIHRSAPRPPKPRLPPPPSRSAIVKAGWSLERRAKHAKITSERSTRMWALGPTGPMAGKYGTRDLTPTKRASNATTISKAHQAKWLVKVRKPTDPLSIDDSRPKGRELDKFELGFTVWRGNGRGYAQLPPLASSLSRNEILFHLPDAIQILQQFVPTTLERPRATEFRPMTKSHPYYPRGYNYSKFVNDPYFPYLAAHLVDHVVPHISKTENQTPEILKLKDWGPNRPSVKKSDKTRDNVVAHSRFAAYAWAFAEDVVAWAKDNGVRGMEKVECHGWSRQWEFPVMEQPPGFKVKNSRKRKLEEESIVENVD